MTVSVPVALGERSYHVHIGTDLLGRAGELTAPFAKKSRPLPVVTDETVMGLHYPALAAGLSASGYHPVPIVFPDGEQSKGFATLEKLLGRVLDLGIERGDLILALGGGVIGDLAGFAAGITKRGIGFAQIPTTLLAQVDSSVGGKTAINTRHGKNLIGLFYQPQFVIADIGVLATLPRRELLSGYAEVVKYGLLGDADFFAWLEQHGKTALAGDTQALGHAVTHSVAMKAGIVTRDEKERGERALLNLGHTFGHALEAATGYSNRLQHGEGVALGCVLAFRLSARLGLCPPDHAERVERHFAAAGLPTRLAAIAGGRPSPDELLAHMQHDKKAVSGRLNFVLARGIGAAFLSNDVPEDAIMAVLADDERTD